MKTGLTAESSLGDRLAWLLSTLLSPLVVAPVFIVFFVASVSHSPAEFFKWFSLCVLFSTGVPAGYIGWNVRSGRITDIHVSLLEQRDGPFKAGCVGLGSLAVVLWLLGAPGPLIHLTSVIFMDSVVFAWISRRWKISVHTGSLGACLAGAIELLDWSPMWLLLLAPLIWARASRKRHRISQGSLGAILGYTLTAYPLRWLTPF